MVQWLKLGQVFVFLLLFIPFNSAATYYVDGKAQGTDSGDSWANGFKPLTSALNLAQPVFESLNYNCVGCLSDQGGNIFNVDPQFYAAPATRSAATSDGDFRIRYSSPAVNSGGQGYTPSSVFDKNITGNPCIVENVIDAGPLEFDFQEDSVSFIIPSMCGNPGDTLTLPVRVKNFFNIRGFDLSLKLDSFQWAEIIGFSDFKLPLFNNNNIATFTEGSVYFINWFFSNAVSLTDSSEIFSIKIRLTGQPTQQVRVDFGNDPQEIFVFQNNNSVPFTLVNGTVCILENTPLPVKLIKFDAINNSRTVVISWSTAYEEQNDYFIVQKSHDATYWKDVGTIAGRGTVHHINDYQFVDKFPLTGTNYYRLIQKDLDGRSSHSEIISVEYSSIDKYIISYSPVNQGISVFTPDLSDNTIHLFNQTGQYVAGYKFKSHLQIDRNFLPKGVYFLILRQSNYKELRKIVVY